MKKIIALLLGAILLTSCGDRYIGNSGTTYAEVVRVEDTYDRNGEKYIRVYIEFCSHPDNNYYFDVPAGTYQVGDKLLFAKYEGSDETGRKYTIYNAGESLK